MARKTFGFGRLRLFFGTLLGACAITLTGCGTLHSARMWFPKSFGLEEVNPRLYVEPTMTAEQREAVQRQISMGRAQVERFYGSITTTHYFVVCSSRECDARFGSYGQPAASYGDMAIRLGPKGGSAPLVAHEWSHAEFYRRAGGWWLARKVPRWFDKGLAVVVANEPRHSEENWQEISRRRLPVPPLGALTPFGDWGEAVRKYGETAGDVPGNLHVVYTAAAHQVRAFLSCAGAAGVATLLRAMRSGSSFDDAYAAVSVKCAQRATPHTARPRQSASLAAQPR